MYLDDGVLHQGLGTHQLVVGGVVHDIQDAALAGGTLRAPGESTGLEAESAELLVATAGAHDVDALATQLGHGRDAAEFVLALLLVAGTAAAGMTPLVS